MDLDSLEVRAVFEQRRTPVRLKTIQEYQNTIIQSHILSNDVAHKLFSNLGALVNFQRTFLIDIEILAEQEKTGIIGDWGSIFIKHVRLHSFFGT